MKWELLRYCRVSSTQDTARELALRGAPEGTVVLADEQLEGRGRRGHRWFSPGQGGLWLSAILRPFAGGSWPPLPRDRASQIGLGAAVAVARAVSAVAGQDPGIKWPNDLFLGGRKFCGILAETAGGPRGEECVILGVGINVNMPAAVFPEELRAVATSLLVETGRPVCREELLDHFLAALADTYREVRAGGFGILRAEFLRFSAIVGRRVCVLAGSERYEGEAVDVDASGALVLRLSDGSERRFYGGEASLRCL